MSTLLPHLLSPTHLLPLYLPAGSACLAGLLCYQMVRAARRVFLFLLGGAVVPVQPKERLQPQPGTHCFFLFFFSCFRHLARVGAAGRCSISAVSWRYLPRKIVRKQRLVFRYHEDWIFY